MSETSEAESEEGYEEKFEADKGTTDVDVETICNNLLRISPTTLETNSAT
tara:strand:- start:398 stop:547 length:150 start_codon:yes stop_codon:yes gene_type:complete